VRLFEFSRPDDQLNFFLLSLPHFANNFSTRFSHHVESWFRLFLLWSPYETCSSTVPVFLFSPLSSSLDCTLFTIAADSFWQRGPGPLRRGLSLGHWSLFFFILLGGFPFPQNSVLFIPVSAAPHPNPAVLDPSVPGFLRNTDRGYGSQVTGSWGLFFSF